MGLSTSLSLVQSSVAAGPLKRRHDLPFAGEIEVQVGQDIEIGTRWAVCHPAGRTSIRDIPRVSRVSPAQAAEAIDSPLGDEVAEGSRLAKGGGFLSGSRDWTAPWNGRMEHISDLSGLGFFRESLDAIPLYARLSGTVVEVVDGSHIDIEGRATAIRCAYGAGGTSFGRILVASEGSDIEFPRDGPEGPWIVMILDTLTPDWISALPLEKTSGLIAPSVAPESIDVFEASPDAGEANAGAKKRPPTVLTEGICSSRMPPALQKIFRSCIEMQACLVASSTPGEAEVILPEADRSALPQMDEAVRIAAGPQIGVQGTWKGHEAPFGRNGAGVVGHMVDLQRDEGGIARVISDNLERLG